MKKFFISIVMVLTLAMGAEAFSLRNVLGSGQQSQGVEQIAGTLGNLITGVLGSDSVKPTDLVGTWAYVSPAISFASDNVLEQLGGAAAATAAENKIAPFYKRFGINTLVLTVDADLNFTMKFKKFTLTGVVGQGEDGRILFEFTAFRTIPIGGMLAQVSRAGQQINITFDVTRISSILTSVAQATGNSQVTALAGILASYDGMYAGARFKKKN